MGDIYAAVIVTIITVIVNIIFAQNFYLVSGTLEMSVWSMLL
jgi:hypothetical protein